VILILISSVQGSFPWETTHRRQSHMKVVPVGNQTYRFVLHHNWNQNKQNIMIDLKSQWKSSSNKHKKLIGSYTSIYRRSGISSMIVRNSVLIWKEPKKNVEFITRVEDMLENLKIGLWLLKGCYQNVLHLLTER
jgi:hypothetical protein